MARYAVAGCHAGGDMQEIVWTLALGAAARGPVRAEEVLAALGALALPCMPCTDVAHRMIGDLEAGGCLRRAGEMLTLSRDGQRVLEQLLTRPPARLNTPIGRAAAHLRLGFLDVVPPAVRGRAVRALLAVVEADVQDARTAARSRWDGPYGARWAVRERKAAWRDLEFLQELLDEVEGQRPAPVLMAAE